MRSFWIGVGPKSNGKSVLMRERQRETCGRGEAAGRQRWRDAAISQGTPGATRSWKKQEEFSLRAFRGSVALATP